MSKSPRTSTGYDVAKERAPHERAEAGDGERQGGRGGVGRRPRCRQPDRVVPGLVEVRGQRVDGEHRAGLDVVRVRGHSPEGPETLRPGNHGGLHWPPGGRRRQTPSQRSKSEPSCCHSSVKVETDAVQARCSLALKPVGCPVLVPYPVAGPRRPGGELHWSRAGHGSESRVRPGKRLNPIQAGLEVSTAVPPCQELVRHSLRIHMLQGGRCCLFATRKRRVESWRHRRP